MIILVVIYGEGGRPLGSAIYYNISMLVCKSTGNSLPKGQPVIILSNNMCWYIIGPALYGSAYEFGRDICAIQSTVDPSNQEKLN